MTVGNRAGNSGLSNPSPAAEPENMWLAIVGKPCLYLLKDIASSAIEAEGVPIIFVALGCVVGGLGSTRQQPPKWLFYILWVTTLAVIVLAALRHARRASLLSSGVSNRC